MTAARRRPEIWGKYRGDIGEITLALSLARTQALALALALSLTQAAVGCSSLFLCEEAMLGPAFSQVDGKLACPKCTVRLGSYTWSGMQCSCGAWVAPAFQVVKSKVDEVKVR